MSAPRCDNQNEMLFEASTTSESRIHQISAQSEFISDSKARLFREPQSVESSDESQVHGRKMLRRVANRRSAQQSRARKKVCLLRFTRIFSCLHNDSKIFYSGSHGWLENRKCAITKTCGHLGFSTRAYILYRHERKHTIYFWEGVELYEIHCTRGLRWRTIAYKSNIDNGIRADSSGERRRS